jgi:predicted TIM-barrel enzyme
VNPTDHEGPELPFVHPYDKLAKISSKKHQLWPVAYVGRKGGGPGLVDDALRDLDAALEGGADALVFVNEYKIPETPRTQFSSLRELETTIAEVRKRHPQAHLGVNWLGDDDDPYGWREGFRLARDHGLDVVWTDFSGVDLIHTRGEDAQGREVLGDMPRADLHAIAAARPRDVFYCSGVHMKYSKLIDQRKSIEESALQAMGFVDGIIVTGKKTGVASDPEVVKRVRAVVGRYAVGVASGVTAENVSGIRDGVDFCLVHTGIQEEHRLVASKVKALRAALDNS